MKGTLLLFILLEMITLQAKECLGYSNCAKGILCCESTAAIEHICIASDSIKEAFIARHIDSIKIAYKANTLPFFLTNTCFDYDHKHLISKEFPISLRYEIINSISDTAILGYLMRKLWSSVPFVADTCHKKIEGIEANTNLLFQGEYNYDLIAKRYIEMAPSPSINLYIPAFAYQYLIWSAYMKNEIPYFLLNKCFDHEYIVYYPFYRISTCHSVSIEMRHDIIKTIDDIAIVNHLINNATKDMKERCPHEIIYHGSKMNFTHQKYSTFDLLKRRRKELKKMLINK